MSFDTIQAFFQQEIYGFTVAQLGLSFILLVLAFALRRLFATFLLRLMARLAARTRSDLDDQILSAVGRPLEFLILIAGIGLALWTLGLPTEPYDLQEAASVVVKVLLTIDLTWLIFRLIDTFALFFGRSAAQTATRMDDQLIPLFRKSLKVFVGILAFVMLVQNMGYSVSGLLAGLRIGGLAVGLAAKDTLANVFGSVAILIDKPFRVDDWIAGEGFEGVVEDIGFRSTRIRTFAKTQVSIPNQQLANMTVNNFSAMPRRRIKFTVGVTYKTTADQMEGAVEGIRRIIREMPALHDDFFLVNFTDFGGSSLDILVYCFTKTTQWADHLNARQELLVRIMRMLTEQGLEVAFPTRSIYIESGDEDEPAPPLPGGTAR
ncbi:MAG: mechanosensitive ion channel [Candidatus Eisenbacteria bacterium]|nr:mechanosensitive ion channel [Candidatus Eisenbacteria bacterium]